jgi:hypothetical protein
VMLQLNTADILSSPSSHRLIYYDSNDSFAMGSFTAAGLPTSASPHRKHKPLEALINFLSEANNHFKRHEEGSESFMQAINDTYTADNGPLHGLSIETGLSPDASKDFMAILSQLTQNFLRVHKDPVFSRHLKSLGWNGVNFAEQHFNQVELLQTVSNIYFKLNYHSFNNDKRDSTTSSIDAMSIETDRVEKMAAFCPDFVLDCIRADPNRFFESDLNQRPTDYSFVGACMLVDISGFSKFSASMCSQGVDGLDELRKVTNGLLGHFVKAVYEHDGDGE